jgi:hypothetical protein
LKEWKRGDRKEKRYMKGRRKRGEREEKEI